MSMSPASSPRRSTRAAAARHNAPDAAPSRVLDPGRSITVRPAVVQRDASPEDEASGSVPNTTGDAVQSILKARKCWRSIKGKEEAVWPPELEAALIEGLEKYKPAESKSTRVLGRFPMRNKFVADHIYDTTGIRRTPKQVGSRIQQLRDTNSGKHILKAISDRHYAMMHPKRPAAHAHAHAHAQAGPSLHAPPPRAAPHLHAHAHAPRAPTPSTSHVYIQTLPPSAAWLGGPCAPGAGRADLHSQEPRPLTLVDPTVTFTSPGRSACQSSFRVFRDGLVVHEEVTSVAVQPAPAPMPAHAHGQQGYMYRTPLVPTYWAQLCAVEDPASYKILQEVVRIPYSAPPAHDTPPDVLLSVYYHFVDATRASPAMSPPLSPHSSCDSELEYRPFSAEPSPLLAPLADTFGLHDTLDSSAVPGLIQPYEDAYTSQPGSPLCDMPLVGLAQWYTPPTVLAAELPAPASGGDPTAYFDPSLISFPHGF